MSCARESSVNLEERLSALERHVAYLAACVEELLEEESDYSSESDTSAEEEEDEQDPL